MRRCTLQTMVTKREQVLEVLFPRREEHDDSDDDNDGGMITNEQQPPTKSKRSLRYDVESKLYIFDEEDDEEEVCVICLDELGEKQGVCGACNLHYFHYDCIMDWMRSRHDDCPTCRQPLWDEEIYKEIEEQLAVEQHHPLPSAPPGSPAGFFPSATVGPSAPHTLTPAHHVTVAPPASNLNAITTTSTTWTNGGSSPQPHSERWNPTRTKYLIGGFVALVLLIAAASGIRTSNNGTSADDDFYYDNSVPFAPFGTNFWPGSPMMSPAPTRVPRPSASSQPSGLSEANCGLVSLPSAVQSCVGVPLQCLDQYNGVTYKECICACGGEEQIELFASLGARDGSCVCT